MQNNKRNKPQRILIIHQNFPGQFRHVAGFLSQQANIELIGIGRDTAPGMQGIKCLHYKLHRDAAETTHLYTQQMEKAVLHGQAVLKILHALKRKGFEPDMVLAHPGWGETLYLREAFPNTKLIHFCEWYYSPQGADVGFDPEFPSTIDSRLKVSTWNAHHLLSLEQCDIAISPTQWQKSQYPEIYQHKINVIHEGIDSNRLKPDIAAKLTMPNGKLLKAGDSVITYVARNLEPYRGFHTFMRTLPTLLAEQPDCHVVIVGGDNVSYGSPPKREKNWREYMLQALSQENIPLDINRVHFLGQVPYAVYQRVLQISKVHVYLTYPFVLSWSLLEAMATGCTIVASDTAPVKEVIQHNQNGMLVDFFSSKAISKAVNHLFANSKDAQRLSFNAQQTAQQYALQKGLQQYLQLMLGNPTETAQAEKHANQATSQPVQYLKPDVSYNRRKSDRLHELGLTGREVDVFECMVKGLGDKDISLKLSISPKTVGHHVSNIITKLEANNRTHAVAMIYRA